MTTQPLVPLGFVAELVAAGSHICQIFSSDEERDELLCQYVTAGLKNHERCACFCDNLAGSGLDTSIAETGQSRCAAEAEGALSLATARDAYFADGRFVPERMLADLQEYQTTSIQRGYRAARVIGEMRPEVVNLPGGSRLLEYEARVSLLLRKYPITSICQYDARAFEGGTMMDVLRMHPMLVVRGFVVRNPFYIPAETFLSEAVG
jgi:hypothetical protein